MMKTSTPAIACLFLTVALAVAPASAAAQDAAATRVTRLVATPDSLTLVAGESGTLVVRALDAAGEPVDVDIRVVGPRSALRVEGATVTALEPGRHDVIATLVVPPDAGIEPLTLTIPVAVSWPAVARMDITAAPGRLYAGTTIGHSARAFHEDGSARPEPEIRWSSSNVAVANVDRFGNVTGIAPGAVRITAAVGSASSTIDYQVAQFPGVAIEITGASENARTGDVIDFQAVVRDAAGRALPEVPITWAHTYTPTEQEQLGTSAPGQMRGSKFVADVPGVHTVIAAAGPLTGRATFEVAPRDVVQQLLVQGQGQTDSYRTTDIWPFEGLDGRDYVITGSKVADGHAFIWDITDPGNVFKTDSIQVDARTVNDVKVSPDGRYGAISREGASNRRNGVVILDLKDPAHPVVASNFDQELTGGVHNVFATNDYLFALSGGDKYVIIDVRDVYNPTYVSEYNHPDSRLHDVWVYDGIAYSAEWETGIVAVDVGNGRWGGSIENPVFISSYALPTGQTHAVFPYRSQSVDKLYLFVGDEWMNRRGLAMEGPSNSWPGRGSYQDRYDPATGQGGFPLATRGYIQVIDFTDPENPEMVARYEVSEYGTHNIYVEDDKLYQAYYEGGLRVVDVSGELMGNLYTQGREIAAFKPFDPQGYVHNATMVWGAFPYKGNIIIGDTNSGVWVVRLQPRARVVF